MNTDDEYSNPEDVVRKYGPKVAHSHYEREREWALDRGEKDEAEYWEAQRQAVSAYVTRRRTKYNAFSFSVGAVLALVPTGYTWLETREVTSTILIFLIFVTAFVLVIRFVDRLVSWSSGAFFTLALGSFGWQALIWLREGRWPGFSVGDALLWLGVRPSFVSIEGWVGVSKIINSGYVWFLERSLPAGCIYIGVVLGIAAVLMEGIVPKMAEEEEI